MHTQLSEQERERYHRQMIFPDWGTEAQEKIKRSTVFVAGAGGLGSPVSMYLAVAGIGTIRICDCGEPELSNLNRQILHDDTRIGTNKARSARQTLERLNPDIRIEARTDNINDGTVAEIVGNVDLIMDCLDNFDTRHVLNRYGLRENIPMIHGGVFGMNGQMTFIHPPETPCLWCIQPGSPPPVLFPIVGATAGVIGTLQALEALKYLSGIGTVLKSSLLVWNGANMDFMLLPQQRNSGCPVCGDDAA